MKNGIKSLTIGELLPGAAEGGARVSPEEKRRELADRLKETLQKCIQIEGDEDRGWTIWVHAVGQPLACASPTRRRRADAETDKRGLVNSLVLALVPPPKA